MPPPSRRPILIAGPTASGKSALALAITRRVGGVIINADSMQVYRELSLITARPSASEMAEVPHRLYGHVAGRDGYSGQRVVEEAGREIDAAETDGLVPIIVGGTGLYFRALTDGLSPIPDIPEEIRTHWRGVAGEVPAPELHAMLETRDPAAAARLRPTDRQRLTRALEVFEATGRSIVDWQAAPGQPVVGPGGAVRLVVMPDREVLNRRCDDRFDAMMSAGALDEIDRFVGAGIPRDRPVWGALGVVPLARQLAGEITLADAVTLSKTETRQFAKRQMTWLKRFMISWNNVQLKYSERNLGCDDSFIDSLLGSP